MEEREAFWENEHTGWIAIQQRRPQTLAFAFNDSPVGQAAWLVDKWRVLSDSNGNLESRFTKDELLTNVTIYWVTQTSGSAGRRYHEGRLASNARGLNVGKATPSDDPRRVEVPTACALFPREATLPPKRWVEARYNLKRWTEMPRGGHFPPLEEPELYVDDVRAFFRDLR